MRLAVGGLPKPSLPASYLRHGGSNYFVFGFRHRRPRLVERQAGVVCKGLVARNRDEARSGRKKSIHSMHSMARLGLFIAFVLAAGFAIGYLNSPGSWYATLAKPWFSPPNWVFAPIWSLIYLLVAIAGWRTWEAESNWMALVLWWTQMALNFMWSPVFFTMHHPLAALAIFLTLIVSILAFVAKQWSHDRTSAALFIPYAVWVSFASVLNFEIVRLN